MATAGSEDDRRAFVYMDLFDELCPKLNIPEYLEQYITTMVVLQHDTIEVQKMVVASGLLDKCNKRLLELAEEIKPKPVKLTWYQKAWNWFREYVTPNKEK